MTGTKTGDRRLLAQLFKLLSEFLVDSFLGNLHGDLLGRRAGIFDLDVVLIFLLLLRVSRAFSGVFGDGRLIFSHYLPSTVACYDCLEKSRNLTGARHVVQALADRYSVARARFGDHTHV